MYWTSEFVTPEMRLSFLDTEFRTLPAEDLKLEPPVHSLPITAVYLHSLSQAGCGLVSVTVQNNRYYEG